MASLLERFLRYVKIDTQSDEASTSVPSTAKQLDLCRLLERECLDLGLSDVSLNEHGVVMATIPATLDVPVPVIAWLAHIDTSPETTGTGVNPQVITNYSGGDIVLPADSTKVIRVADNSALQLMLGKTVITTDGTTLLGADDKAGIAVIMTAAAQLIAHPEIPHGPIRICFTCDEEIGRGVEHIDLQKLGAVCGYTLDGDFHGCIDTETFSADQATVTVTGVSIHPSIGKGRMVNAVRILSSFLTYLPTDRLSPETTAGRQGFIHPYRIEGTVETASVKLILRDFETSALAKYGKRMESIAARLRRKHPRATIQVHIENQYRNMRDGLKIEPRAISKAIDATKAAGLHPYLAIIRGGTDGAKLTERGLPTPNLSTGEHNSHSPLEWACVEEMESCARVLIELARAWGIERTLPE